MTRLFRLLLAVLFGLLCGVTLRHAKEAYDRAHVEAYNAGYQKGLEDAPELTDKEFKQILTNNQDLLNKTCYVWWFKMNHAERKLK